MKQGLECCIENINKCSINNPVSDIGKIFNSLVDESNPSQDKTRIELFNHHNTSVGRYLIGYSSNIGYTIYQIPDNNSPKIQSYTLNQFTNLIGKNYSMKINSPRIYK